MTGYTTGTLADEAGADELLRTAAESVAVSRRLGTPSLNLHGTGLDDRGLPVVPADEVTPAMWDTARRTLGRIAELGEREGVTFVLENLNTAVDHPRTPFARAADTLDLVRGVDSPTCGSTSTSTTPRSARGTSSSSAARRCPGSPRCRWPTCPAGASRAPGRSATRGSPAPSRMPGSPASSASRRSPAPTRMLRWPPSATPSPSR